MNSIKLKLLDLRSRLQIKRYLKNLDVSDVSIISMSSIGGIVYHYCKRKFLSPTVNLFFTPGDFIKFVNNLEHYLSLTPTVYMGKQYTIGKLGDITVFFMHYDSCESALSKWEERKTRINFDKIFVIVVERNGFTEEDFENFKKLEMPKLLFTKTEKFKCDDSLYMSKYKNEDYLPDIILGRHMYDKGVLVKKINSAFE